MGKRKYPTPTVGKQFSNWTVIDAKWNNKGVKVRCICGTEKFVILSQLHLGKSKGCFDCRNKNLSKLKYQGYEDLSKSLYNQIKFNAIQRDIEFNISIEYLWKLFVKQDRKCSISGVELELSKQYANNIRKNNHYETASLDRIDSTKGYIEGNVQWVHKEINYMKRSMSMSKFLEICKTIVNYNENKYSSNA